MLGEDLLGSGNAAGGSIETFSANPSASILIQGLRDFGYTLETALADVVDNSITAGARRVDIRAELNHGTPRIAIIDDGTGMTADELRAAMRPGSRSPSEARADSDLGRFGLGLKTASFSQCRRLTVVTRRDGNTQAARWDLDFVAKTDQWLVLIPEPAEWNERAEMIGDHGTVVLWEDLDRVVDVDALDQVPKEFAHKLDQAGAHLELVFHRFLSGERGLDKVRIALNRRELSSRDPFNSKCPATISGPKEVIGIAGGKIAVQPYTLPHHSMVSIEEWERYALEDGYLKSQGFYLYRAKRLIVSGTWFGLAKQTELTKLARVRIDMPNGMDELWKVNVLKASAQPPHIVRQRLRRIIEALGAPSKRVYVGKGKKLQQQDHNPIWQRLAHHGGITYRVDPDHPAFRGLREQLDDTTDQQLRRVLELVSVALPLESLLVDLGDSPEKVTGHEVSDEALELLVRSTFESLTGSGVDLRTISLLLKSAEPYRSNWVRVEGLLDRFGSSQQGGDIEHL